MERRVKVVATLGPAVNDVARLRQLMEAGADVLRVNAAHGSPEERAELIANVREAADAVGKRVPLDSFSFDLSICPFSIPCATRVRTAFFSRLSFVPPLMATASERSLSAESSIKSMWSASTCTSGVSPLLCAIVIPNV